MTETEKTFTLFWLTGLRQLVRGPDIARAMTSAGYGAGALRALDFYAPGDCDEYLWDRSAKRWVPASNAATLEP